MSVKQDKTVNYLDLVRDAIEEKYELMRRIKCNIIGKNLSN
jgi:hypothetical protein|tara:strand:- start:11166 stop:11288 length:123 start_codon:yes stop_codon:yes gene_type:complete